MNARRMFLLWIRTSLVGASLACLVATLAACSSSSSGPAQGSERGECYPNGTCNTGLACRSGICVREIDLGPVDGRHLEGTSSDTPGQTHDGPVADAKTSIDARRHEGTAIDRSTPPSDSKTSIKDQKAPPPDATKAPDLVPPTPDSAVKPDQGAPTTCSYLYAAAGLVPGGSVIPVKDIVYSAISSSGSPGAWGSAYSLSQGVYGLAAAPWTKTTFFLVGGADGNSGAIQSGILYGQIGATGTITALASTTALPAPRYLSGAAVVDNRLYVVGGYTGGSAASDVIWADINAGGSLGSWQTTNYLPTARMLSAVVAHGGYLYVLGGSTQSGTALTDVLYAKVDSSGGVSSWSVGTAFYNGRWELAATAYNGYMYIAGGRDNGSTLKDVQYAAIGSSGNVGSWSFGTSLNLASRDIGMVGCDGTLYVWGGDIQQVTYSKIGSAGSPGSWSPGTSMSVGRDQAAYFAL
jgi:hypothetical protein